MNRHKDKAAWLHIALRDGKTDEVRAYLEDPDALNVVLRLAHALAPHDFGGSMVRSSLLTLIDEWEGAYAARQALQRVAPVLSHARAVIDLHADRPELDAQPSDSRASGDSERELSTLRSWRASVVARSVALGRKVPGEGLCEWFETLHTELVAVREQRRLLTEQLNAQAKAHGEEAERWSREMAALKAELAALRESSVDRGQSFDSKVWTPLEEYSAQIDKRVRLDKNGRAAADDLFGLVQSDPEGAAFEIVALRRLAAASAEEHAALVECEKALGAINWGDATEYEGRIDASLHLSVDQLHAVRAALSRLDAARKAGGQ